MQNELVSIIIPTYNRFDKLERAVVSAINQKHKNIEIIITSDNEDEINDKLKEKYEALDNRIKFLVNKGEKCVGNWNNGLNHANGNFIKILFDDDWMNEDCIKICIEKIGNHNGITFKCNNHLSDGSITCGPELIAGSHDYAETLKLLTSINLDGFFDMCVSPCAYFFKNNKIRFQSNFKEDNRISNWGSGSDIIYVLDTLLASGEKEKYCLLVIEDVLVNFESHENSTTVKNLKEVMSLTLAGMIYAKKKYIKKIAIGFI